MKIYSDNLSRSDFENAAKASDTCLSSGIYTVLGGPRNSRKARFCYDLHMSANPGYDRHGIKRAFSTNSGSYGAGPVKACTWIEWGDFIAELFKLDPDALIGPYAGARRFVFLTLNAAPHRPERESAQNHAGRWREELVRAGIIPAGSAMMRA